jgi:hypothetical protein
VARPVLVGRGAEFAESVVGVAHGEGVARAGEAGRLVRVASIDMLKRSDRLGPIRF